MKLLNERNRITNMIWNVTHLSKTTHLKHYTKLWTMTLKTGLGHSCSQVGFKFE